MRCAQCEGCKRFAIEKLQTTNLIWTRFHDGNFNVLRARLNDLRERFNNELENGRLVFDCLVVVVLFEVFANRLLASTCRVGHILIIGAGRLRFVETRRSVKVEAADEHRDAERAPTGTLSETLKEAI